MRSAHFLPIMGNHIFLNQEVLKEIGIDNGCHLYALFEKSEFIPSLILSPIPSFIWPKAYKLIINLTHNPGTLTKMTNILVGQNTNIFSSYTAAVNALGQTCWSSIVELPKHFSEKSLKEKENSLKLVLEKENLLPKPGNFPKNLEKVILRPLKVLQALHEEVSIDTEYSGLVEEFSIDLKNFKDASGRKILYDSLITNIYSRNGYNPPNYCILTTDTQEAYFRLTFLPLYYRLYQLNMELKVTSINGRFEGYFGSVLSSLSDLNLNVYSANNLLLSKKLKQVNQSETRNKANNQAEERARFNFTFETSDSKVGNSPREIKEHLEKEIKEILQTRAKKNNDSACEIIENSFQVTELQDLFPVCYFATNAPICSVPKNGTEDNSLQERGLQNAKSLYKKLISLGFRPLNVDIAKRRTIFEEVTSLIESSVILISLHLPIRTSQLKHVQNDINELEGSYSPTDWVLFEESYALGLGKRIFRLRHETVRTPRYALGEREFVFGNDNFGEVLSHLEKAIKVHMSSRHYLESLAKTEREIFENSPDFSLLNRNLAESFLKDS